MSMSSRAKRKAAVAPVSLGCGTLIIIAIIVAAFGQPELEPLEREVGIIKQSVDKLQHEIRAQTREIRLLRDMIAQQQAADGSQDE